MDKQQLPEVSKLRDCKVTCHHSLQYTRRKGYAITKPLRQASDTANQTTYPLLEILTFIHIPLYIYIHFIHSACQVIITQISPSIQDFTTNTQSSFQRGTSRNMAVIIITTQMHRKHLGCSFPCRT